MDRPHLSVHLSIDGHLGCFHFWVIMNKASINLSVQIFVWIYALCLLVINIGVELLSRTVTLRLTVWETVRLISRAASPCHIPPAVYEGSNFSTFSPALVIPIICPFHYGCPSGHKVVSWYFDLHFSHGWSYFHVLIGYWYICFGKPSIQILCPFLLGYLSVIEV